MLIMKLRVVASTTDHHVFTTPNNNILTSFPQSFLKKKLHERLYTSGFSAPLIQATYTKRKVYATRANNNTEKTHSLPNAPLRKLTIDNASEPENIDNLHVNKHEDYDSLALRFTVSHDLRKADGTFEPVPAEILEDSEDSVRTIDAALHGNGNNPQETPGGLGGVGSTPNSISDMEKSSHDNVVKEERFEGSTPNSISDMEKSSHDNVVKEERFEGSTPNSISDMEKSSHDNVVKEERFEGSTPNSISDMEKSSHDNVVKEERFEGSTPNSISDMEKSSHDNVVKEERFEGTHDHNNGIGSRRRIINRSDDTLSSKDRNGVPIMHLTSDNPMDLEWPHESGVRVGEKGEAIVEDVSVIPLEEEDPDKSSDINVFEDRMKFGWSECACDEGSVSKDSRDGKIPRDIEGKGEELEAEKLAQWEQEVFKADIGKTPDDYHRRADIFELSGEAFLAEKKREEAKSHIKTIEKTHVEDTNVDM